MFVRTALTLVAIDREGGMIASLAALIVAGFVVALSAVLLLWRELHRQAPREEAGLPPSDRPRG